MAVQKSKLASWAVWNDTPHMLLTLLGKHSDAWSKVPCMKMHCVCACSPVYMRVCLCMHALVHTRAHVYCVCYRYSDLPSLACRFGLWLFTEPVFLVQQWQNYGQEVKLFGHWGQAPAQASHLFAEGSFQLKLIGVFRSYSTSTSASTLDGSSHVSQFVISLAWKALVDQVRSE